MINECHGSHTDSFVPKDIQCPFHPVWIIALAESFVERWKNVASRSNIMLQYAGSIDSHGIDMCITHARNIKKNCLGLSEKSQKLK